MAKIITVYINKIGNKNSEFEYLVPISMALGRWIKISEALSRLGHQVDLAVPDGISLERSPIPHIRRVHLSDVNWKDYDIVKTEFHRGFSTLEAYGGHQHPFIISKLGSVVGASNLEGIYFYGEIRNYLFEVQRKINTTSKYITLLTEPARRLWEDCFGKRDNVLIIPGAADLNIPPAGNDPYPENNVIRCLFAGNIYSKYSQPEANKVLVDKLNMLGKLLQDLNITLYMLGPGDVEKLDPRYVTYLGVVPLEETWNYFHHAHVGIVVSAGNFMHNNESTKIYHYLRAGLPVVSETGFPNDGMITESKLGFLVEGEDMDLMAIRIREAALKTDWNRNYAQKYISDNHTWDQRVGVYGRLFKECFPKRSSGYRKSPRLKG